uniref:F-box associated beta-propeller type 1 domain-containing protein n=1 Tax=Aegilops tauschii subsp. strangulata TaxID=200361 RepID=A0A453H4E2_AEGTS
ALHLSAPPPLRHCLPSERPPSPPLLSSTSPPGAAPFSATRASATAAAPISATRAPSPAAAPSQHLLPMDPPMEVAPHFPFEDLPFNFQLLILGSLGTRDAARFRCVSKLYNWRLNSSYFMEPLADAVHVVAGAEVAEALLLYRAPGEGQHERVINISVALAMTGNEHIPEDFLPTHVCNGFVLFHKLKPRWDTIMVLNPISGEIQSFPEPDPTSIQTRRVVAMGYAAATKQYKVFRFHFCGNSGRVNAITLSAGEKWRDLPDRINNCYGMSMPPPPQIAGELYMFAKRREADEAPRLLLILDVETEAPKICSLPDLATKDVAVGLFDLRGQPCLTVHEVGIKVNFMVLRREDLTWHPRYTFSVPVDAAVQPGHFAWLDCKGLHYMYGNNMYTYDISVVEDSLTPSYIREWGAQCQLPLPPANYRVSMFGGYCPNWLSPHTLDVSAHDRHQYVLDLLHAIRHNPDTLS